MNIKRRALRLMGRHKLENQFDLYCYRIIKGAVELALNEAVVTEELMKTKLEAAFDLAKTHDRLIHAFMVIACDVALGPSVRGIVNAQALDSDGYVRCMFEVKSGRISFTTSRVYPSYSHV